MSRVFIYINMLNIVKNLKKMLNLRSSSILTPPKISLVRSAKTSSAFSSLTSPKLRLQFGKLLPGNSHIFKKTMKNMFGDKDKDGVFNALDCKVNNPKKHGGELFWEKLKEKNISIHAGPREKKTIRRTFEKNPEFIKKAQGAHIAVSNPLDFVPIGSYAGEEYSKPEVEGLRKKDNIIFSGELFGKKKPTVRQVLAHELVHRQDFIDDPKKYEKRLDAYIEKKDKLEFDLCNKYRQKRIDQGLEEGFQAAKILMTDPRMIKLEKERECEFQKAYPDLPGEKRAKDAETVLPVRKINVPEEQRAYAYKQLFEDKDGDGFIAAADRDDNNPNNPRGAHYKVSSPLWQERQNVPHWFLKQLNPTQQKEAFELLKQNVPITDLVNKYSLKNPFVVEAREKKYWTREQKLQSINDFYQTYGRNPTLDEFQADKNLPSKRAYTYEFGSWNKALIAAGRTPIKEPKNIVPLQVVTGRLNRLPTKKERWYEQPEAKERKKEWRQQPENQINYKQYQKEWKQKPHYKEYVKKYSARPEVKERASERYYERKFINQEENKVLNNLMGDDDDDGVFNGLDCDQQDPDKQEWDYKSAAEQATHITHMAPREYLAKTGYPGDPTTVGMLQTYGDSETGKSEQIHKLKGYIKAKNKKVTIPYMEGPETAQYSKYSGTMVHDHEGRHRAYAAYLAGHQKIPVRTPIPKETREEISDEFSNARFPKDRKVPEWRKNLEVEDRAKHKRRVMEQQFPQWQMDKKGQNIYANILKKRGMLAQRPVATAAYNEKSKGWEDDDDDGIFNLEDCDKDNPNKQGFIHNNFAYVYHGTKKSNLKNIKKRGLKPQKNYWGENSVFLTPTKSTALYYAKKNNTNSILKLLGINKKDKNSDPVVLSVRVPLTDVAKYTKDDIEQDHPTKQIQVYRTIKPQDIKVVKHKGKDKPWGRIEDENSK